MKFKKTVAVAIAAVFALNATAFAAVKKDEIKEKPVYTYEQVLEKALKNNSDLSLMEQNLELMDKQSSFTAQDLNGLMYPGAGASVTLDAKSYELLSSLNGLAVAKRTQRYKKEALEKSMQYTVMSTMTGIEANKAAIDLSEKQLSVYQGKYNKSSLMNRLGMVSQNDVLAAKAELEKYESALAQAKLETENAYKGLARLMGMTNADFEIAYSVEYVPYKLIGTISEFAASKNKTNPTLIGARIGVENLINTKNISASSSDAPYSYDSTMYSIAEAEAGLKGAEDGYKAMIEGTYKGLLDMETKIKGLEDSFELAQRKLSATEENFKAGRATKLELDEDEVNVKSLENGISALKMSYTYTVYGFENPCALPGGGSAR